MNNIDYNNHDQPYLSISCITFNHAPFVRDALDGFLMQKTTFSFEILICDDASTDGTADIIREYEQQYPHIIKPIYQKENQFSKGIRLSPKYQYPRFGGKYVALCEGDDYWTNPYKLQKQVDFLEAHPDYVISFHDCEIVDEKGKLIKKGRIPPAFRFDYTEKELISSLLLLPTPSLVFRNLIKELHPGFHISELIINGDAWLVSFLGMHGKAHFHDDIFCAYRKHSSSMWSSINKKADKLRISIKTRKLMLKNTENKYRNIIKFTLLILSIQLILCEKSKKNKLSALKESMRYFCFSSTHLFLFIKYIYHHFKMIF